MKKTVVISSYDDAKNPFYAGGGATAVHQIAKRISPQYEVTVLTGNYKGAKNLTIDNVKYKRIGFSFFGPKLSQLVYSFLLPYYASTQKFDVWIENFTPPFSVSLLPIFTTKPVIGLVQMLTGSDMQRKYKLPFPVLERMGVRRYTQFVVLSQAFKKKLTTIHPKAQIAVIPVGVEKLPSVKRQSYKQMMYMGRLEYNQKGLDLLLHAFALVAAVVPQDLVIAGSGSRNDLKHIKKTIRKLKLSQRVHLVGKVKGREKDHLLRTASLVVIPSRYDTFVTVALEALSYGKPIVGFDIDGLSWVPKSCIAKATPFDISSLAKNMILVAEDPTFRKKAEYEGPRIAEKHLWDRIISQYLNVIKKAHI